MEVVKSASPMYRSRILKFSGGCLTLPILSLRGVSIEAEVNGEPMVFPLGPNLYLSWAACTARTERGNQAACRMLDFDSAVGSVLMDIWLTVSQDDNLLTMQVPV